MADEELGDITLTQYSKSGGCSQGTDLPWMRYSHGTSYNVPNSRCIVPDRFSSQNSSRCCGDENVCKITSASCSRIQERSSLYYSPPGTSYTIVERPMTAGGEHPQYSSSSFGPIFSSGYRSRPLSLSPKTGFKGTGTKRPMSPEEVLNLFGSSPGKGKPCMRRSQSPVRSTIPTPPRPLYFHQNTRNDAIIRTVTMTRQNDAGHGFGVCVKGGKDLSDKRPGVYISRVEEGSVAERVGLKPGDYILEANGVPFNTITHEEALKMLKSCRKLSMTVQSPNTLSQAFPRGGGGGGGGGPLIMRQSYSWMDREGRPVSPPLEYSSFLSPPAIVAPKLSYPVRQKESGATRKVDLNIDVGQSLGLMIRGGLEYGLGIFITGVDKDSVAERAGLMVGDQILEVNGQSFLDVTHDEAVNQLKIHKRMTLLVKDVGKVPHSCTAYDRSLSWQPFYSSASPDHVLGQNDNCSARQMVQEKARVLLNKKELLSLSYYQEQYSTGRMNVEAFVLVLLDLLNTPDKHNLMTELREVILPQDRVRFDNLVYRRAPLESDRRSYGRKQQGDDSNSDSNFYDYFDPNAIFGASRPSKIPVLAEGVTLDPEEYNTPSEDSGVCLGDGRASERASWIAAASPTYRNQTLDLTLSNGNCSNDSQSGYLEGLKSQFDGWTKRVKSWYWGRPLELTHKLSRSFDMKEEQRHSASAGENVRRHQSMQKLSRADCQRGEEAEDSYGGSTVVHDEQGNLRITVSKTKPILGIAIEGGANTRHPLPRIINIHENGAAYEAGGLEVGQLILEVDGKKLNGMHHHDIARLIAESFAKKERREIEFLVVEAKKSNLEPKPTALIFLEA